MSDPVITPETEEPGSDFETSEQEEDREADEALEREQRDIAEAVQNSAHELEQLAAVQLTGSLAAELSARAASPVADPLEIITKPPVPGSRLEGLRSQLEIAAKAAGGSATKIRLLSILMGGVDLTAGMTPIAARDNATALLTHLVYSTKGQPLPELAASPAAQAVIDLGGKLATMSDAAFWRMMSSASEDAVASIDALRTEIGVMGMSHEMKPLTAPFTWPTADAVVEQVDQLVAAATMDPDRVDLAALYRRAGTLSLNGAAIPRAVAIELVRLALADLVTDAKFKAVENRVPARPAIEDLLKSESGSDAGATARNALRSVATSLLAVAPGGAGVGAGGADVERLQVELRASRGHLREYTAYTLSRISATTAAMEGGAAASQALQDAVTRSAFLSAIDEWSAVYRAGETDPAKLRPALALVAAAAKALVTESNARLPTGGLAERTPESNALSFLAVANMTLAEVAVEVAELLRIPPSAFSDPLAGPARTAENATARARARAAATDAAGRGRLYDFLSRSLPEGSREHAWAKSLLTAASAWSAAETRDAAQVIKAGSAFADALSSANADLHRSSAPAEVFVGEGLIDALATGLSAKIAALAGTDPQISAGLSSRLTTLTGLRLPSPSILDMAEYWNTKTKGVSGLSKTGPALAPALTAWEAAATDPAHSESLVAATYDLVDALIAKRSAISASAMSDRDKAVSLRALDDMASSVAARLSGLLAGAT